MHQIHKEKVHDKTLQRVQEYWLTVMKERRSSENSYHNQHRDTRLYVYMMAYLYVLLACVRFFQLGL